MSNIREALRLLTANGGMELTDDAKAAARLLEASIAGHDCVYHAVPLTPGDTLVPQAAACATCGQPPRVSDAGQPAAAEVSDGQIDRICYLATEIRFAKTDDAAQAVIDQIRAILALRPQAVPTTDAWAAGVQAAADLLKRMADETALERGETDPDTGAIQFKSAATREWHASLCELAEEIERLKPAHHGITAPAGGEG